MSKSIVSANNNLFYISGVVAFSIYFLCLIFFIFYVNRPEVKKFDSLTKTTVLELDVMIIDNIPVQKRNTSVVKNTKKSEKIVKKSASKTVKQSKNVQSLFANVKTNTKKVIKEEVTNVTKSDVASRFKSKFEKQRKTQDVTVSKLLNSVNTKASVRPSTDSKNNNDPYFSKIYELLASRWKPMLIVDGLSAKVLVIISSSGDFDYRFLEYSGNERFDDTLRTFLNNQKIEIYPTHDRGRNQKISVTFTAKKG